MFGKKKTKLKLTGRAGMIYSDTNGRVMKIDSEMLACGEYDMVIYERSMQRWQPPFDHESITEKELLTIKQEVERHLKRCHIDWQA